MVCRTIVPRRKENWIIRLEREITLPVGVVVERRAIDHPWAEWSWKPVAVLADPPAFEPWQVLTIEDSVTRYLAATVQMSLHRRLVEAYRMNLAGDAPKLWAVLQEADEADTIGPYEVHLVTASPYEAQDYLDSGDEIVEALPMPKEILDVVLDFVKAHPLEEVFKKRKRDRVDTEEVKFSQQPIFARVQRSAD